MTEIGDFYGAGWLRRWVLVEGVPRCVEDAVRPDDVGEEAAAAIRASNAEVRTAVEAVEAYEAAMRLASRPEPEATVGVDQEGDPIPNPAYLAWSAAADLVATTGPEVLALAALRAGEGEPEA